MKMTLPHSGQDLCRVMEAFLSAFYTLQSDCTAPAFLDDLPRAWAPIHPPPFPLVRFVVIIRVLDFPPQSGAGLCRRTPLLPRLISLSFRPAENRFDRSLVRLLLQRVAVSPVGIRRRRAASA